MTYATRFWAQVNVKDAVQCWEWQGRRTDEGYGRYLGQFAHRVSLHLSGVPLDNRLDVNHVCRNKACVSPFHAQVMAHRDHSRITATQRGSK